MELKKNLDLSITLRDEEFSIDVTEPESGEVISMTHYYAIVEPHLCDQRAIHGV